MPITLFLSVAACLVYVHSEFNISLSDYLEIVLAYVWLSGFHHVCTLIPTFTREDTRVI